MPGARDGGADEPREVIVIGSGPAGFTAALYAARAELCPLVLCGEAFQGGALATTTEVENYPGFPEGVQGPELMDRMRAQAERFGAETLERDVVTVELTGPVKRLTDSRGAVHRARAVIVATGAGHRRLGLPREDELAGHGVSWCATCDGFFFRGQDLVVVGGGDTALEEACFLSRYARSVTVVHRRPELRASRVMRRRALVDPGITFLLEHEVVELRGATSLTGVVARSVRTGGTVTLPVTGLFEAIGHIPRSELFAGVLDRDENGYLRVEPGSTRTAVPGVFAAGDVADHVYRQAVTAAGSGCAAALDAERYLAALGDEDGSGEGGSAGTGHDGTGARQAALRVATTAGRSPRR
ncbi:thioredoxin-disulfide reductase [Streptomyces sp. LP05-1]|uniref:Thioredoxin reductase n=1 Tax=Streptomyces pyxinae TaxID=2970734 RepID=A0ABT2CDE1_9ACTN|nr:thioredoxin-disulfide reductase [Streptomyces sp. LP05-1]MCS0635441.1 thioredoxin-disulfide reductase [Streptomyces sp. LP05-1]